MRIALVSEWDTTDPRAWSGVVHPLRESLSDRLDLEVVRLQAPHHVVDRALAKAHGALGRPYLPGHSVASARLLGRRLEQSLRDRQVDAVLAVAASTTVATARLDVPVVQVTDATIHAITDYYPLYSGLGPLSRAQAEWLERRAQQRTDAVVTTSAWARDSFVEHYGMCAGRVTVAPFGPAIRPPSTVELHRGAEESRVLRALVVSSDWERKGGDHAVAAVSRLRRAGIAATLTVVGQCPVGLPDWVRPLGTLSRNELSRAYAEHDVLLELATANAGGVTLTDAAAHGLPVIATDTGGVPEIVKQHDSGILVRTEHDEDAALMSMTDASVRRRLCRGALQHHQQVLNWDVWSHHVENVLSDVVKSGARGRGRGTVLA